MDDMWQDIIFHICMYFWWTAHQIMKILFECDYDDYEHLTYKLDWLKKNHTVTGSCSDTYQNYMMLWGSFFKERKICNFSSFTHPITTVTLYNSQTSSFRLEITSGFRRSIFLTSTAVELSKPHSSSSWLSMCDRSTEDAAGLIGVMMISVAAAVVRSNAVSSFARESSQPSHESNVSSQGRASGGDDDIATNKCEGDILSITINDTYYI